MKAISASIIVFSGALLLAAGSHVSHNDTKVFVQGVGCVIGLIGLMQWWKAMERGEEE